MTSQDEITRTADRLKDAFGAAADVMTAASAPVAPANPEPATPGSGCFRAAAASVVVIVLAEVLIGHPATNTSASGSFTQLYRSNGKAAPLVTVPAPDPAVLNSPGEQAADSRVVKIVGSAPTCAREIQGSGFVYAPQHVITNAHVVAGVTRGQTVTTANGVTHRARVVFYDPRIDIAVLDVPGLNLAPLRFSTHAHADDNAVVAGYPENHSFTAAPARIGQVLRGEPGHLLVRPGRQEDLPDSGGCRAWRLRRAAAKSRRNRRRRGARQGSRGAGHGVRAHRLRGTSRRQRGRKRDGTGLHPGLHALMIVAS